MANFERALSIATEAHAGQTDKAGMPYIMHPLRVAAAVPDGDPAIVAILHDVVEDTPWTLERLRNEGFSEAVIDGVDAVTRRAGETYLDFVDRAARNHLDWLVKRADLIDNMDHTRLGELSDIDRARLKRYSKALAKLEAIVQ